MKIKRILHITGTRELGSGQRSQLKYESNAAKNIKDTEWDTIVYHSGKIKEAFEKKTPFFLDFIFLRNLYFWIMVLKHSKQYDLILFRHVTFDPFALFFSPFIKNRISVHHSKEIEELKLIRKGLKGKIASFIEKITGKIAIRNSLYIAGVTQEIAMYENTERGLDKEIILYPNGIEVSNIPIANDFREENNINILFICSYFAEWHGLDILLNEVNLSVVERNYFIHLVGKLSEAQKLKVLNLKNKERVIIHGEMNFNDYFNIASKCDVALGSLAMYRQNLHEGSTLKVREMLAMGLPVFSGHKDAAFGREFKYYYYSNKFDLNNLLKFCEFNKKTKRHDVKNAASKFIEKKLIMKNFIQQINLLKQ